MSLQNPVQIADQKQGDDASHQICPAVAAFIFARLTEEGCVGTQVLGKPVMLSGFSTRDKCQCTRQGSSESVLWSCLRKSSQLCSIRLSKA